MNQVQVYPVLSHWVIEINGPNTEGIEQSLPPAFMDFVKEGHSLFLYSFVYPSVQSGYTHEAGVLVLSYEADRGAIMIYRQRHDGTSGLNGDGYPTLKCDDGWTAVIRDGSIEWMSPEFRPNAPWEMNGKVC